MKTGKNKETIIPAAVFLLTVALLNQAFAESAIRITTDVNVLSIHADKRPLLLYRYKDVPFKPYIRRLFSPAGVNILRDAPADHLHHHALMFAVKVDGVNFWEEAPTAGKQLHKSFTDAKTDTKTDVANGKRLEMRHAGFTEHIDWNDSGGQLLLKEKRTIEIYQAADLDATLLTWKSEFELPEGAESATLTGAHYHGLGMRFLKSMDTGGRFINADNKTGTVFRGQERLLRSTWCAYTSNANGKPVTVAMFDHPQNPRHPATWFTMTAPFAYLSATLNLHKEPLKVISGKPLVLRYAVALWDGIIEPQRVNKLYRKWAANQQADKLAASTTNKLPQGFVRGDVVSYSYVPIRHWSPGKGIGILPYLFEYNLMAQKDGTPLESFHEENIRRIDIASRWSTAIMLYPRQPEYRDEIINLMLRCYKNRQLIILVDYHNHSTETCYEKVRAILDKLWLNRDKSLTNPERDTATGQRLINNILAVKLGDEGLCGLGTKGLEKVYDDFNKRVRYWKKDDQTPFTHIRGWYNLISYTGLDYKGCYAASRRDVEEHSRHALPVNTQAIGVDVYHYWFHRFSPFDPADLSIPREKVRAHTTEWHRLRTKHYPEGLNVRVCKNSNDPATWLPECWNDTHAMLAAIDLAGAKEAMMWFIGNSGQIDATGSKDIVTYTTPAETMEMYYENLKAGPWVALSWWVFGNFKDTHGGLEYYDKKLMHYTPLSPEGVPYSDKMLDYWHNEYVAVKMRMFNDVVYKQFAHLNAQASEKPDLRLKGQSKSY